ncbi:hypothetical protein BC936DRAFT_142811 [Jimgerdemannia flammicorona]|uniref:Uncharacterized protein n=1 Tax=Jimgerdemannia flammicorona TaxID=994334 RepID=A0A432ZZT8_9FUNG|nr:hypothetical protein BC936DRAFT_142811 [Jimgerdemannia flammicorona]
MRYRRRQCGLHYRHCQLAFFRLPNISDYAHHHHR